MREVPFAGLQPMPPLPAPMLHKSGQILVKQGEELTQAILDMLKGDGIDKVIFPDPGERVDELRHVLSHIILETKDLAPGTQLTRSVYDTGGQLLLEQGATIPATFADSLSRRGIAKIYQRRPEEELGSKAGRDLRARIELAQKGKGQIVDAQVQQKLEKIEMHQALAEDLDAKKLQAKIDSVQSLEVSPEGEAFSTQVKDTRKLGPATKEEKSAFQSAADDNIQDMKAVFRTLAGGEPRGALPAIDRVATRAMAGMIRNRELLTLYANQVGSNEDYLVSHALAMTAVAVNIATAMKFGPAQIKSLAYGAMFADVGMLKVPAPIVAKSGKLSPPEFAEIRRHPVYGLDILQAVSLIPAEVPFIVYQSHERANGTGYPCGKKDVIIHTFARIVAVADVYTALCASRPHRPAKLPYEAMEQVVLMCGKRLLNTAVVRAFLSCNSMFPVGSFVRLSSGYFGRVVAANAEDYMRPIVAILFNVRKDPLPKIERINLLEKRDVTVTQAVGAAELPVGDDPALGF